MRIKCQQFHLYVKTFPLFCKNWEGFIFYVFFTSFCDQRYRNIITVLFNWKDFKSCSFPFVLTLQRLLVECHCWINTEKSERIFNMSNRSLNLNYCWLIDSGFIYNQLRHFGAVTVIQKSFTVILAFPTTCTKALIAPIRR